MTRHFRFRDGQVITVREFEEVGFSVQYLGDEINECISNGSGLFSVYSDLTVYPDLDTLQKFARKPQIAAIRTGYDDSRLNMQKQITRRQ